MYTISWQKHGVIRTFSGVVDAEEVMQADIDFYHDPRSDKARFQIADFTDAEPGSVEKGDPEKIAALDYGASRSNRSLKVAFVTDKPYVVSLCEAYIDISRNLGSNWKFRIFERLSDAQDWVSV